LKPFGRGFDSPRLHQFPLAGKGRPVTWVIIEDGGVDGEPTTTDAIKNMAAQKPDNPKDNY